MTDDIPIGDARTARGRRRRDRLSLPE